MSTKTLRTVLSVNSALNCQYTDFCGESRPFSTGECFALVYLDTGSISVFANDKNFFLKNGTALFLPPESQYTLWCDRKSSVLVAHFTLTGSLAERIKEKTFGADSFKKTILSKLVSAGTNLFSESADFDVMPEIKDDAGVSVEQVIKNCLELFILDCVKPIIKQTARSYENPLGETEASRVTEKIYEYLGNNLEEKVSLDDLSEALFFSKSYLKTAFFSTTGKTIMQAFKEMKIQEAKRLIRSGHSAEEIAKRLAYCNKNYFYKVFSSETGMTPSEYKKSLGGVRQ